MEEATAATDNPMEEEEEEREMSCDDSDSESDDSQPDDLKEQQLRQKIDELNKQVISYTFM